VNVRSTFCTPLVAVAIVLSCFVGCSSEVEPKIVAGVDACRVCNMVIDRPREACGYIHSDEFVTFDSPVCLLRGDEALHRESGSPPERVWFADYNEGTLHPAESMTFLMTDRIATAMESGVLIFAEPDGARTAGAHPGEVVTDWDGFRLRTCPEPTSSRISSSRWSATRRSEAWSFPRRARRSASGCARSGRGTAFRSWARAARRWVGCGCGAPTR
jgi:hypothetical protein